MMTSRTSAPRSRPLALMLALSFGIGALINFDIASAQQAQPTTQRDATPRLVRLIDNLDDDDFAVRESATRALENLKGSPEDLVRLIESPSDLSLEQWRRLDTVLEHRFRRTPRAGLGVGFDQQHAGPGVALNNVLPNFPAADFLHNRDIILQVDKIDLHARPAASQLPAAILSHDPGETIELVLLRADAKHDDQPTELTLRVPLGVYIDLGNGAPGEGLVRQAWPIRRDRIGLPWPAPEPILVAQAFRTEQRSTDNSVFAMGAVAGGQALPHDSTNRRARATRRRVVDLRAHAKNRILPVQILTKGEPQTQLDVQLKALASTLAQQQRTLELLEKRLELRTLPDIQRGNIEDEIQRVKKRIGQIAAAIDELSPDE